MSSWKIKYSDKARTEIDDIFDYISGDLNEPVIAKNLVQLIFKEIYSLEPCPEDTVFMKMNHGIVLV